MQSQSAFARRWSCIQRRLQPAPRGLQSLKLPGGALASNSGLQSALPLPRRDDHRPKAFLIQRAALGSLWIMGGATVGFKLAHYGEYSPPRSSRGGANGGALQAMARTLSGGGERPTSGPSPQGAEEGGISASRIRRPGSAPCASDTALPTGPECGSSSPCPWHGRLRCNRERRVRRARLPPARSPAGARIP
jgi:hypothetical protein